MGQNEINIRLKESNPAAFEELYKQTFPRLLGYCRLFVQDQDQANDLVQDCFVKLWEKRHTIKPNHSIESLLFVMLRNKCFNYLRDQRLHLVKRNINLIEENELQRLYQLDFIGREEKKLEESLIEAIQLSVNNLPEKRKLVFEKAKIDGRKNKEVAEELGISVKAVEKHLHQAKVQIQQEMLLKFPLLSIVIVYLFE